ncbi:hypothetical protein TRVL_09204 [Trypanosoma vivax]|nr:hypothetical protein TRVL_09204 [Trypanosoma vivax]
MVQHPFCRRFGQAAMCTKRREVQAHKNILRPKMSHGPTPSARDAGRSLQSTNCLCIAPKRHKAVYRFAIHEPRSLFGNTGRQAVATAKWYVKVLFVFLQIPLLERQQAHALQQ